MFKTEITYIERVQNSSQSNFSLNYYTDSQFPKESILYEKGFLLYVFTKSDNKQDIANKLNNKLIKRYMYRVGEFDITKECKTLGISAACILDFSGQDMKFYNTDTCLNIFINENKISNSYAVVSKMDYVLSSEYTQKDSVIKDLAQNIENKNNLDSVIDSPVMIAQIIDIMDNEYIRNNITELKSLAKKHYQNGLYLYPYKIYDKLNRLGLLIGAEDKKKYYDFRILYYLSAYRFWSDEKLSLNQIYFFNKAQDFINELERKGEGEFSERYRKLLEKKNITQEVINEQIGYFVADFKKEYKNADKERQSELKAILHSAMQISESEKLIHLNNIINGTGSGSGSGTGPGTNKKKIVAIILTVLVALSLIFILKDQFTDHNQKDNDDKTEVTDTTTKKKIPTKEETDTTKTETDVVPVKNDCADLISKLKTSIKSTNYRKFFTLIDSLDNCNSELSSKYDKQKFEMLRRLENKIDFLLHNNKCKEAKILYLKYRDRGLKNYAKAINLCGKKSIDITKDFHTKYKNEINSFNTNLKKSSIDPLKNYNYYTRALQTYKSLVGKKGFDKSLTHTLSRTQKINSDKLTNESKKIKEQADKIKFRNGGNNYISLLDKAIENAKYALKYEGSNKEAKALLRKLEKLKKIVESDIF